MKTDIPIDKAQYINHTISTPPSSTIQRKRYFELLLVSVTLPLILLLLGLISFLILVIDGKPVILQQPRLGLYQQRFLMYKFRTMMATTTDEQIPFDCASSGEPIYKSPNDPRVTRLGSILRRTSLDELPQLFNVLKGEMSLVGPRPLMPVFLPQLANWQLQRFKMTPGMTGWWQVNGRSHLPLHIHTEYDLYYIEHYSIWLDVKILFLTISTVISGDGAW